MAPKPRSSHWKLALRLVLVAGFLVAFFYGCMFAAIGRFTLPTKEEFAELALCNQPLVEAIYSFRDDHGTMPKRLDDLAPRYLPTVPDPYIFFDGNDLMIHARAPHTYVCFSFRPGQEGWSVGGDFFPGPLDVPKPVRREPPNRSKVPQAD